MIGNGILAFAVILVVVIFVYMSMRLRSDRTPDQVFAETYVISLERGFAGDSVSLLVNDSLIYDQRVVAEPLAIDVRRFAEQSALQIVDHRASEISIFDLGDRGGSYRFERDADGIKLLGTRQENEK
jgi:hypothetical protein